MYIKVTKSGDRRYIQLAESYRDSEGRSRQRIIANLGRLDDSTSQANSILAALLQASGQQTGEGSEARLLSTAQFESARALGDVWALTVIWKQLGFDRLKQLLKLKTRHRIDLEALLR
ncbi:IS1634 family transposase, partial [Orrella sp. 11846]